MNLEERDECGGLVLWMRELTQREVVLSAGLKKGKASDLFRGS